MKKLSVVTAVLFMAASVYAQDAASVAMPFSTLPRTVGTLSLGGVTASDDVSYRLLGQNNLEASASWYSWAPKGVSSNDINVDFFSRFGRRLGITAQFALDAGKRYDIYNDQGVKGGFFSPKDMMIKAGAAYRIIPMLSVGISARYLNSSLSSAASYSAFSADVMASAELGGAKASAGVTNLGSSVKSSDGSFFSLPSAATVAGSYSLTFAEKHSVDARAQVDFFFKGGLRAGVGVEYGFGDLAFARVGYSYGGKSPFPSYLSLGVGAKFSGVGINAAYLVGSGPVGGTLAIGAGYSF